MPDGDQEILVFDEAWYLQRYPDVALAVQNRKIESGLQHYISHGKKEGRPGSAATTTAQDFKKLADHHKSAGFLVPGDLAVSPLEIQRFAIVGSCFLDAWGFHHKNPQGCPADFFLSNNSGDLPESPEHIEKYDFQIVQLPLRAAWPDSAHWHAKDEAEFQAAFDGACRRLEAQLKQRMRWNIDRGLLTFVTNFFCPQNSPLGALMPRYSLANPEYFVDRINQHLESIVRAYKNAYILDIDRICASVGRRYVQDDLMHIYAHNSIIVSQEINLKRIETVRPTNEHYDISWRGAFLDGAWASITGMLRTLRQMDPVKMVVIDLDDTLWSGVSGDSDALDLNVEGWELGFAEALMYLKKRGILIAIISKNDEERVRGVWPKLFGARLKLENFAITKINWTPKVQNMKEILASVNLLPRNVLFIDDNPVERAAMKSAFPSMRIIGAHPYYHKRILLWSPETQVAAITEESGKRTEMIQAQSKRETQRQELPREEFLASLSLKLELFEIADMDDKRFLRAFELINKTNQFNTTGKRWSPEDFRAHFSQKGRVYAFSAEDKFTPYGLVGALIVTDNCITQFVMSCRVAGLDIERAALSIVSAKMRADGAKGLRARFISTDANLLCRDVYKKFGFAENPDGWNVFIMRDIPKPPDFIKVTNLISQT